MACLRCGSAWLSVKGKDMVSCPECCKQQRCKARKQGRLPSSETKTCERCGVKFEAVGGNAIRRGSYCKPCRVAARKEWLAAYKQSIADVVRVTQEIQRNVERRCVACGKQLRCKQEKYCGRRCYFEARANGDQAWDRTGQLESNWHRGGMWACAPSRKPVREITTAFVGFIGKLRTLMRQVSHPRHACMTCNGVIADGPRKFCSDACKAAHVEDRPCRKCGKAFSNAGGRSRRVCLDCIQQRLREERRNRRRRYGGSHSARARHHGVKYVAFPVRSIYERDGYRCQLCGRQVLTKAAYRRRDGKIHPRSPTIDHIVPMCKGGNHEPANCQTACFICNSRKGGSGGGQLRLRAI